jgi:hypothetical protein
MDMLKVSSGRKSFICIGTTSLLALNVNKVSDTPLQETFVTLNINKISEILE